MLAQCLGLFFFVSLLPANSPHFDLFLSPASISRSPSPYLCKRFPPPEKILPGCRSSY
jgi:hypothetical protein